MKGNVNVIVNLFQMGNEFINRISNLVSNDAICIRTDGNADIGHKIVVNNEEISLHFIPTSITKPGCVSIISPGVIIDLQILTEEIKLLTHLGVKITPDNFIISPRSNIILPGQVYEPDDEANLCMYDLISPSLSNTFNKVSRILTRANELDKSNTFKTYNVSNAVTDLVKYKEFLSKYINDEREILFPALEDGSTKIVVERAQYFGINQNDSTNNSFLKSTLGTISTAGIGVQYVKDVYGIINSYSDGSFNLDLVWLKNAVMLNSVTALCINHLDTLGQIGLRTKNFNVCTSYVYKDKNIQYVPIDKNHCRPIYKEFFGGWDIAETCTTYEELPKKAKEFIEFVEDYIGIPVKFIGIGPDEKDTIIR